MVSSSCIEASRAAVEQLEPPNDKQRTRQTGLSAFERASKARDWAGERSAAQFTTDNERTSPSSAPLQFLETAKGMVPGVSRTALYRAWDASRGIGGGGDDALETRMQGERFAASTTRGKS